jgi:hypothetical protein
VRIEFVANGSRQSRVARDPGVRLGQGTTALVVPGSDDTTLSMAVTAVKSDGGRSNTPWGPFGSSTRDRTAPGWPRRRAAEHPERSGCAAVAPLPADPPGWYRSSAVTTSSAITAAPRRPRRCLCRDARVAEARIEDISHAVARLAPGAHRRAAGES